MYEQRNGNVSSETTFENNVVNACAFRYQENKFQMNFEAMSNAITYCFKIMDTFYQKNI